MNSRITGSEAKALPSQFQSVFAKRFSICDRMHVCVTQGFCGRPCIVWPWGKNAQTDATTIRKMQNPCVVRFWQNPGEGCPKKRGASVFEAQGLGALLLD